MIVHNAPAFTYALPLASVGGRSDTVDIDPKALGIHNKGTGGEVKVTWWAQGRAADQEATIFLAQGEFLLAPVRRVWATGTAVAEADLVMLYP